MASSLDNLEKTQLAPSARAAVTSLAFGSIPEVIAEDAAIALDRRLGYLYARERLGIEGEHEASQSGGGLSAFSIEKLISRQFLSARCSRRQASTGAALRTPRGSR